MFKITRSFACFVLFLLAGSALLVSCNRKPHWEANVSGVPVVAVEFKRYEQVLFNLNPFNLREDIDPYVEDFKLFLGDAIDTPQGQAQLYDYITDDFIREIWLDTQERWSDVSALEDQLSQAFRFFRYHFPERPMPVFYSYISGLDFEHPVKFYDNNLIVGLDMFLGTTYANYERVRIPAFKRQRFLPEAAAVEVMRSLGEDLLRQSRFIPETFLDHMITEGKLLYFVDCMLPQMEDSLKIGFTGQQIHWAYRNQGHAWAFYLDNEMLYSTDRQLIQKFIGASPFTAPFSRNSAPRMGVFSGWQIVREYMRRNPDVSLAQLMLEKEPREILNRSRYRP